MFAEILVLGFAAALGYGISAGLEGHMAPEPLPGGSGPGPAPSPAPTPAPTPASSPTSAPGAAPGDWGAGSGVPIDCETAFDALPTGGSDIDNLRNAAKLAYAYGTSSASLLMLAEAAERAGAHDAATCLRVRAAQLAASGK